LEHIDAPNFQKKCATFCAVLRNFLRTWLRPAKNVAYKPINPRNIMIDCATSCALEKTTFYLIEPNNAVFALQMN